MVNSVIDRTVRRVLGGTWVESAAGGAGMLLAVTCILAHTIVGVVSARCSGESLQVSDYCVARC